MGRTRQWMAAMVVLTAVVGTAAAYGWPWQGTDAPPLAAGKAEVDACGFAGEPAGLPFAVSSSAVALRWSGPAEVKVNRPNAYTLTVANACGQPLQKVVVQVRVPAFVAASDARPEAKAAGGVLLWELGSLDPKQTREVAVSLACPTRGDLTCQAWVTHTGAAVMTAVVREPKLAVSLAVPESVAVGDAFQVRYEVSNPGDASAEKVTAAVTEPAAFIPDGEPAAGVEVNDLSPTAKRTVTRSRVAHAAGDYTYRVTASSPDGQAATATARVRVLAPKLVASVSGPAEVGLNRTATYVVKVTNVGDYKAEDVRVRSELGAGLRNDCTTDGSLVQAARFTESMAGNEMSGFALQPGETRDIPLRATTTAPGTAVTAISATARRNVTAAAECRTVVRGVPGIRMEVIDVLDPVAKGQDAVYEVRVSNTGTETDTDLKVVCTLPPALEFMEAAGPVGHAVTDGVVAFEPIRELGPKAEVVLRVKARAVAAGNTRFHASLTSRHLTEPVRKEESTTVYGE